MTILDHVSDELHRTVKLALDTGEAASIDAGPCEREKQEILPYPPRIVFETSHFQTGQLRRERFAERHSRQQLAELHRPK